MPDQQFFFLKVNKMAVSNMLLGDFQGKGTSLFFIKNIIFYLKKKLLALVVCF